jgi:hypothetical protein
LRVLRGPVCGAAGCCHVESVHGRVRNAASLSGESDLMKDVHEEPRVKRPYQSPELVRITLRAEEAVLGKCKTFNHGGPGGAGLCRSSTCKSQGS